MDIKQGNADLFNIHSCAYVESVAERRKLWLDNSRIKLDVQRELNALPIDTFSCTAKSSADLLGSKATDRLKQELESRKSAHDYNLGQLSVSAIKNLSSGQKQNHQPKHNNSQAPKPSDSHPQPFRGRGRVNRHGRGGGRGGRGSYGGKKGGKSGPGAPEQL